MGVARLGTFVDAIALPCLATPSPSLPHKGGGRSERRRLALIDPHSGATSTGITGQNLSPLY